MILIDLLKALKDNPGLKITIFESDRSAIVTFNAAGYQAINSEITEREVDEITIAEVAQHLKLYLKEVIEPELDPDQLSGSVLP